MKRFIFIPFILSGAFVLSSCTLLDLIKDHTSQNSQEKRNTQMKFYSSIDGEPSDSLDFNCPYSLMEYTYSEILNDMDDLENPKINQNLGRVNDILGYYYAKTFYVKNTGNTIVN